MGIQNIDNKELKRLYQPETTSTRGVGKPTGREAAAKNASSVSGKDQATLSESARLMAESLTALHNAPSVRTELVERLKQQIESGNYEIPYEELAKKLASIVTE